MNMNSVCKEYFEDIEDLVDAFDIEKLKEKLREKKAIFIPVPVNKMMSYHEPNDNLIVLYPDSMRNPFDNVKEIIYKETEYECKEIVCGELNLGSLGSNTIVILDELEKVSQVVVMFTTNYTPETSPVITYDRLEFPWTFPLRRRIRDPNFHFF